MRKILFGTIGLNRETGQFDYWMSREQKGRIQRAESKNCPDIRSVIGEMKLIEPIRPDPPGLADKDFIITADGIWYTLEGHGAFSDGHLGKFRMEANVGTPLSAWAQRVEHVLSTCWE